MALTTWKSDPKDTTTTHVGCVLDTWECTVQYMSDVWDIARKVLVWNIEKGAPETKIIYYMGGGGDAVVDATDEVKAASDTYKARQKAEEDCRRVERCIVEARQKAEAKHNFPVKGKTMVVKRGYKAVKRGMEGVVFWVRDEVVTDSWGWGNRDCPRVRVGLRTSDAKDAKGNWADVIWCNASQLCNKAEFEHTIPDDLMAELQEAEDRLNQLNS